MKRIILVMIIIIIMAGNVNAAYDLNFSESNDRSTYLTAGSSVLLDTVNDWLYQSNTNGSPSWLQNIGYPQNQTSMIIVYMDKLPNNPDGIFTSSRDFLIIRGSIPFIEIKNTNVSNRLAIRFDGTQGVSATSFTIPEGTTKIIAVAKFKNNAYTIELYDQNYEIFYTNTRTIANATNSLRILLGGTEYKPLFNVNFRRIASVSGENLEAFDIGFAEATAEPITNLNLTSDLDSITATWTAPAEYDSFNVYKDGVLYSNVTGTSETITGLTPGASYDIMVKTVLELEESTGSIETISTQTIAAPTALKFTSNYLDITASWTAPAEYDSFNIYVDGIYHSNTIISQKTITGLQPDKAYEISIKTVLDGYESAVLTGSKSTENTALTPTGLYVTSKTEDQIRIAWNIWSACDSYNIYVDDVLHGNSSISAYTIDGLDQDTLYEIHLTGVIGTWESNESLSIQIKTDKVLTASPVDAIYVDEVGTYYIDISWEEDPENSGYYLYLDGVKVGETIYNTYHYTSLLEDTEYILGVKSYVNDGLERIYSDMVTLTTSTAAIPPGVTYLEIKELKTYTAIITWAEVPEAQKYRIYLDGQLHSTFDPDVFETEIRLRPGRESEIYATILSQGVYESTHSNHLFITLEMPNHETNQDTIFGRLVDIFIGIWPGLLVLLGIVIAAKVIQIVLKYIARV